MSKSLRLLVLEDSEDDFLLTVETLRAEGYEPEAIRVETREDLAAALNSEWDVILSDYTLPRFNGKDALEIVRSRNADIPFIVVSGTVGEEVAAELMRAGANDYLLKSKLSRLSPVIDRELRDARARQARREAETALRSKEQKYRSLVEQASDAIVVIDGQGALLEANRSALVMTGYSEAEISGRRVAEISGLRVEDFVDSDEMRKTPLEFRRLQPGQSANRRRLLKRKDGSSFFADISTTALDDGRALLVMRDATAQVEAEKMLLRRERQQRAIASLGELIAGGASREQIMTFTAGLITDTLGMDYCRTAECDLDGATFRARTGCTLGTGDCECTAPADYVRRALAEGKPIEFGGELAAPAHACLTDKKVLSVFSIGIGTIDHPIAIIDAHSVSGRKLDAEELSFLQSLSSIVGSAIEQRRSEEALRRSEQRFRRYFDLDLVGMATTSPEKGFLQVNDRLCEMFGYERSELLRMTWLELTHRDDVAADVANFNRVLANESDGYSLDKRFIRKDGSVMHATISVRCVRAADGSVEHLVALVQDVTERKLAENELFRREQEFKALVERNPDVVSRFDRSFRHVYVSPSIERFTGLRPAQLIGRSNRELGMSEALSARFESVLNDVFTTGEERVIEFPLVGPAGEQFFQVRVVPEFNAAHEVESVISVGRDITAIRRSEAQLAAAQRIAMIGSWETNLETGLRTWSAETFRLMDLPVGDVPSEEWVTSRIHEDDRQAVAEVYARAIRSGEAQSFEHRMRTASGREKIFSIIIEPQKNSSGKVVALTGTDQDVTELREAERALRRSEQRLRALIESANDFIVTLDMNGTVIEMNPAVVRLMGESESALLGRSITHSIHPDHVQRVLQGLAEVIARGKIAHIEAPLRIANGEYVDIEATAARVASHDTGAIFVIGRDVTERKRAEAERQQLTEQIQRLLDSTYEGICSMDAQGRATLLNRAASEMLGYDASELIGQDVHALVHHRHADGSTYDATDCAILKVLREGHPAQLKEVFWRKDGTSFPVDIFVSPIFAKDEGITGIVTSFVDVSEREFLHAELERANRLTGLGRVAATMSHEFNNVLMGIQPFAELLVRTSNDPKVLEAATRIGQSVNRGRRVTEELRRFTRPTEPVRSAINVHSWLEDSVKEFRRLLPHNIVFESVVPDLPMAIMADRDQIAQVVSNAIINARDAIGSAAGSITLTASVTSPQDTFSFRALPGDKAYVQLSVSDDGPGISKENLARVVEPFFTTKRNGTGLGLAIAQQIITLHGGYMFIDSTLGQGTVVRFFLPAAASLAETSPTLEPRARQTSSLVSEVLVIEDEDAVAEGLRMLLAGEGIDVLVATTGADAMRILEKAKPQLLVVDISLPDCDGFELYQRIVAGCGPLPVIFSSGHADRINLDDLAASVPTRILTKPYDFDTLLSTIGEICKGQPEAA
jgi:PAS domain S-box-containing protein